MTKFLNERTKYAKMKAMVLVAVFAILFVFSFVKYII